jgi:hypothetical protein
MRVSFNTGCYNRSHFKYMPWIYFVKSLTSYSAILILEFKMTILIPSSGFFVKPTFTNYRVRLDFTDLESEQRGNHRLHRFHRFCGIIMNSDAEGEPIRFKNKYPLNNSGYGRAPASRGRATTGSASLRCFALASPPSVSLTRPHTSCGAARGLAQKNQSHSPT